MDLSVNAVVNTGMRAEAGQFYYETADIEPAVTDNILAAEVVLVVELQSDVIVDMPHSRIVAMFVNLAALVVSVHPPRAMHTEKAGHSTVLVLPVVLTAVDVQIEPLH